MPQMYLDETAIIWAHQTWTLFSVALNFRNADGAGDFENQNWNDFHGKKFKLFHRKSPVTPVTPKLAARTVSKKR